MAERKGFEPLRGGYPPTGFQDRTLKPLGYLSRISFLILPCRSYSVAGSARCSISKKTATTSRLFALELFCSYVAQKERFELSRCSSHPTPLAGEPLRPLGYFCKPNNTFFCQLEYLSIAKCQCQGILPLFFTLYMGKNLWYTNCKAVSIFDLNPFSRR